MPDHTATAISEGDHWVVDVPGIGTTEAATLEEVPGMALDLVVARTHADRAQVHLRIDVL